MDMKQATIKKVHIIGGGTFQHIRPHLSLSAPAFGTLAKNIYDQVNAMNAIRYPQGDVFYSIRLHLTAMAGGDKSLVTNEDLSGLIDTLVADKRTRAIFMTAAVCDFKVDRDVIEQINPDAHFEETACIGSLDVGKDKPRLRSSETYRIQLTAADKILGKIREERKDIFLVACKTTWDEDEAGMFERGFGLLKANHCNLVLVNDVKRRTNMVVTPEGSVYAYGTDRLETIRILAKMARNRMSGTFIRTEVKKGETVSLDEAPETFRDVMRHLIANNAYKPFNGKTVGHYSFKAGPPFIIGDTMICSRRGANYNEDPSMVIVDLHVGKNVAHGAKPSAGAHTQQALFKEFPQFDCVVHFHCPMRPDAKDKIPVAQQAPFECGSTECGINTSSNVAVLPLEDPNPGINTSTDIERLAPIGEHVGVVMLDKHGPNILFNRKSSVHDIIAFIERNFDLSGTIHPTKEREEAHA